MQHQFEKKERGPSEQQYESTRSAGNAAPIIGGGRRRASILVGLVLMGTSANAAATYCRGSGRGFVDIGNLSLDVSVPVGDVLATITTRTVNGTGSVICYPGTHTETYRGSSSIVRGRDVYSSNVPGIGYRFKEGGTHGTWWPITPGGLSPGSGGPMAMYPVTVSIQLVKTGEITGDGVLSGEIAYRTSRYKYQMYNWGNAAVVPFNPSCTLTVNGGRDVELGRHHAEVFTGVGSTSSAVPFNITSGGCNADTTRVHMSWRGTADANDPDTFRITNGALRGVGVWIEQVSGGTTMTPNGPRQSFDPPAVGQNYEYRARFKQTLPAITEGAGSAAVTIDVA